MFEGKYSKRDRAVFSENLLSERLGRDAGISIENGKGYVWLHANDKVEVNPEIARSVAFLITTQNRLYRHRKENVKMYLDNFKRSAGKIIDSSNCHKTLLFLLGVDPTLLRNKDRHVERIQSFFVPHRMHFLKRMTMSRLKDHVMKNISSVPLAVTMIDASSFHGAKGYPHHTFVILGKDNAGRVLCIGKSGREVYGDVQLETLDEVTKGYDPKGELTYVCEPFAKLQRLIGAVEQDILNEKKSEAGQRS